MRKIEDNGGTTRQNLLRAARGRTQGAAEARDELRPPPFPDELGYVWDMFLVVDRMRPVGMSGVAPLTAEALHAANQLFRWQLDALEVEALNLLDLAVRFPDVDRDAGGDDG